MTKYREIIRLSNMGLSQRSIASSCQCSRNTVSEVLSRAILRQQFGFCRSKIALNERTNRIKTIAINFQSFCLKKLPFRLFRLEQ